MSFQGSPASKRQKMSSDDDDEFDISGESTSEQKAIF